MHKYQTIIANYFRDKPVKRAYLFGSVMRGEAKEDSDIDVLVDLDYEKELIFLYF